MRKSETACISTRKAKSLWEEASLFVLQGRFEFASGYVAHSLAYASSYSKVFKYPADAFCVAFVDAVLTCEWYFDKLGLTRETAVLSNELYVKYLEYACAVLDSRLKNFLKVGKRALKDDES